MPSQIQHKFPVFVMCGRDSERRQLMQDIDPEGLIPVKALLPFLGRRLVEWQLDALSASAYVENIYLLGLCEDHARFDVPLTYIPTDLISEPAEKLSTGLNFLRERNQDPPLIVISTSDAPAVTRAYVDEFLEKLMGFLGTDFVLSVVPEKLAESAFPNCGRVVARFRDHQVFPGELYALSPRAILVGKEIITEINQRRRKINRTKKKISMGPIIRLIAKHPSTWPLLVKFLLGQAKLSDGERMASLAFGGKVESILIEDAGFGMDIDLPGDYRRLEEFMRKRMLIGSPQASGL